MTIGKLAATEGVSVETVRFYQRRGLLAEPPRRGGAGYREYSDADRDRLGFIRRARALGFTLGEIAELVGPAQEQSSDQIAAAAQAKISAIDEQINDLIRVRCRLRQLARACEQGDGQACAALQVPASLT